METMRNVEMVDQRLSMGGISALMDSGDGLWPENATGSDQVKLDLGTADRATFRDTRELAVGKGRSRVQFGAYVSRLVREGVAALTGWDNWGGFRMVVRRQVDSSNDERATWEKAEVMFGDGANWFETLTREEMG
jgi:hypothetical protein